MNNKIAAMLAIFSLEALSPDALRAETPARDVAVAARSVSFFEPKPSGATPVAVIYQSGDKNSQTDAELIRDQILTVDVKGISFQPRLVASDNLAAATGVRAVFLATGLRQPATVFAAATRQHAITIGFDRRCIQTAACVMTVKSQPAVEIVVSRSALQATSMKLSQAFLMLIKEQ